MSTTCTKLQVILFVLPMIAAATSCNEVPTSTPTIFGSGSNDLPCDQAVDHPYPVIAGDYESRPQGKGHVAYYGTSADSYDGSPEVVWRVQIAESGTYSLDLTFDDGDDLDLMILESCDSAAVPKRLTTHGGAREHANIYLESATYYMVADGFRGQFGGSGVMLQIARVTAHAALAASS